MPPPAFWVDFEIEFDHFDSAYLGWTDLPLLHQIWRRRWVRTSSLFVLLLAVGSIRVQPCLAAFLALARHDAAVAEAARRSPFLMRRYLLHDGILVAAVPYHA